MSFLILENEFVILENAYLITKQINWTDLDYKHDNSIIWLFVFHCNHGN